MSKTQLPFIKEGQLEYEEYNFSFTKPSNLPLVVWTNQLSKAKKRQLELICGLNSFPNAQLEGKSPTVLDRQLENVWEDYQTNSILIVGDYLEFPPMKFKTQYGVHYSDFLYADVGNEGSADVGIGRVFGSINTITQHLQMKIGDSNEAFLFETDPERSSATIEAVKALGFESTIVGKYNDEHKTKIEEAELIMQISDGLISETIHGSPAEWVSAAGTIMSHKNFEGLNFKNYPLIFSESCSTASFGPLLANALRAGACYYGATSPSANNPKEFSNWRSCAFADGVKMGLLDVMDEVETLGQVVQEINKNLYESLSHSHQEILRNAMNQANSGIDIPHQEIATILQFNLFGNPERPVVVGIEPDFDAGIIHFDT